MTVPIPSLPLHWHQPLWLVSLQGYWGQRSHRANGEGLQYGGSYPSQMTYHVGGYVPATAAAKSLQSCLPLCGPIDSSPPGSSVHGKSTGVGCHCLLWIMSLLLPILIGLRNYSLGCKNTMEHAHEKLGRVMKCQSRRDIRGCRVHLSLFAGEKPGPEL